MKRKVLVVMFALVLGTVFAGSVGLAAKDIPVTITIDKAQAKKPPVIFPHKDHADKIDCLKCHHKARSKEDVITCFKCHGTDPDAPDPGAASARENPFHIRCRGCHKEEGKGPSKCKACHAE